MLGIQLIFRALLSGFSPQLAHPYRMMILRAMETIVSNHISELDKDMVRAIILLASSEMTKAKVGSCWPSPLRAHALPVLDVAVAQDARMWFGSGCLGLAPRFSALTALQGGGPPCHFRGRNRSRKQVPSLSE